MNTPTFVSYKIIRHLFGCSHSTAAEKLSQTRAALGKTKLPTGRYQPVSVAEFCEYWDVKPSLLCEKSTTSQAL